MAKISANYEVVYETFQYTEVRFLSQKAFDGPVETDVFVL